MKNFIIFGFMVTVITLTSCSSNEETSNRTVPTSEITAPPMTRCLLFKKTIIIPLRRMNLL